MGKSISLDIAALILLIILLFSSFFRKMTSGISNRIFLSIIITAIISTLFDISAVRLDNMHSDQISLLYTVHAGYLISHYLSVPLLLLFVISLTDTWHKLRTNYLLQTVLALPLFIMLVVFMLNASNKLIFSVENGYTRGPLFILIYVTTGIYLFFDIIYIVQYRTFFSFDNIMSLSAVIPFEVGAMVIQMFIPDAAIEMLGLALSILVISIGIQRPEDRIDSFTTLNKFSAYVTDMKRNYYNYKHVTVIMLNISNYQSIQSMIGFDFAMEVLEVVADKIREIDRRMRGCADLYYLDNCRFRVVFSGKNQDKADRIASMLNHDLKKRTIINGYEISLAPYIVLARCPEELGDFKTLMLFGADFHKKNAYTGQIMKAGEVYNKNQLNIQNNIDAIIDRALENGSFQVYYQPIYSTTEGRFVSAEALIRLIDPQHGFISPETMIVAAEQSGAIHKIGELVFEKVCQFIASDDFEKSRLSYIEVNLSVAEMMNRDLPEKLFSIMKKYNISPDKINLEITETATAYDQKVMTDNLEKLAHAGLSFSLDDYGTGYSNIQRVIQLPLKIIKLDKSFVDEQDNPKMWIFLKNTVKMLKDMDMEIVVEGIETQEMVDAFSDLKCDFIQGYFFSKPIPRNDFVTFIMNSNEAS